MSRNISALLFGISIYALTFVVAPFVIAGVDQVWWEASFPGSNDIVGREFLASTMGLGGWLVALIQSVSALERDE